MRLTAAVAGCARCPAMAGRRRVLGPANGSPTARILVVAEAPGRLGADRTGVPLSGDRAGLGFGRLLAAAGWTRADLFVTNAVLCNPRDPAGRNRPPTTTEVANCRDHLAATLDLLDPPLVLALGARALDALDRLAPHGRRLADSVGVPTPWHGRTLIPLYHPAPRALIHRPLAAQIEDWRNVRAWWDAPTAGYSNMATDRGECMRP